PGAEHLNVFSHDNSLNFRKIVWFYWQESHSLRSCGSMGQATSPMTSTSSSSISDAVSSAGASTSGVALWSVGAVDPGAFSVSWTFPFFSAFSFLPTGAEVSVVVDSAAAGLLAA